MDSTVPVSVGQRLLGIIDHYRADHGALNCPLLCRLRGDLDVAALRAALDELTARHEALRTTITGRGPRLAQTVHTARPVPLNEHDLRGDPRPATALEDAIAAELSTRIDVGTWPTRATLWRIADRDRVLCVNMHHLVTDAWSCGVLFGELGALYAWRRGRHASLPAPPWQYRDFVAWQQEMLNGTGLDRHRAYWQRQLRDLRLPRLPYRQPPEATPPGVVHADLPPPVVDGLRAVARTHRTTLFTVTLALYYAVLYRVTGQADLAVASLFANRSHPAARHAVGFLANMVVLRTRLPAFARFTDVVRASHDTTTGAIAHQEQPYQTLPLDPVNLGGGRVDDVVFQMMAELDYRTENAGTEFELLVPERIGSRFGTELALAPRGRGLRAVLFHTARLPDPVAAELLATYTSAAAAAAADPTASLSALTRARRSG